MFVAVDKTMIVVEPIIGDKSMWVGVGLYIVGIYLVLGSLLSMALLMALRKRIGNSKKWRFLIVCLAFALIFSVSVS